MTDESRNHSRRTSLLGLAGESNLEGMGPGERRVVKEGEVEAEKERGILRAS